MFLCNTLLSYIPYNESIYHKISELSNSYTIKFTTKFAHSFIIDFNSGLSLIQYQQFPKANLIPVWH